MEIGETLYVTTAEAWREWLTEYHARRSEIWLVFYSKGSGKASLSYGDAVDEALCFGWIDSVVKKYGEQGRAQRFTPRRPGSAFSEMNKARVRRLAAAGRMTPEALETAREVLDEPFEVAADIEARLLADDVTWNNFLALPESYRRIRIGFIEMARNRPEMFERRLAYFLKMTRQNKRYGMVH